MEFFLGYLIGKAVGGLLMYLFFAAKLTSYKSTIDELEQEVDHIFDRWSSCELSLDEERQTEREVYIPGFEP